MKSTPVGVRKGAWTEEEDALLRKCIQKYGEGKWHQVPLRAGLNRCRKSCRLRWLNYLRPDIKRGGFGLDEVDLMIRLHKLLGNRWSLIAGRLPGRTANDVKNYWNTHMHKKLVEKPTIVIRPRPRTFSKNLPWLRGKNIDNIQSREVDVSKEVPIMPPVLADDDNIIEWCDKLFVDSESGESSALSSSVSEHQEPIIGFWSNEISPTTQTVESFVQGNGELGFVDMDIWHHLLSCDQTVFM